MDEISEELRKQLWNELTDTMIDALDQGTMLTEESEDSASFILERVKGLNTTGELLSFLEELGKLWNPYYQLYLKYKGSTQHVQDTQQIESIQNKLKQYLTT